MTEALKIDKPDCSDTFEIQTELQTAHTEELEHDRFTHKITLTVDEDTKKPQNLDKTYILVKNTLFCLSDSPQLADPCHRLLYSISGDMYYQDIDFQSAFG